MSPAQRSPGLDTLRALAILCVMPFHVVDALPEVLQPAASFGWMGVDLFFVLSGYLIGGQLLRPAAAGRKLFLREFYLRRAWRILPAYLAVLALYLWVPAWRERPGLPHAWQFLTFTLNLNIDYAHTSAFSHAWSLCVEEHFYLVLPLLLLFLLRKPSLRRTAIVATTVFAAGLALRCVALEHLRTLSPDDGHFSLFYLEHIYYPTWTRLDGLLSGVLLAATQTFRPRWWQALLRSWPGLLILAVAALTLSVAFFKDRFDSADGLAAAGVVFGFPILALGFSSLLVASLSAQCPLSRPLPGMRMIAVLAYSLYLTHKSAFHLVQLALPQYCETHRLTALVLYALSAFGIAGLLYFTVERPCLRLGHGSRSPDAQALANPAL